MIVNPAAGSGRAAARWVQVREQARRHFPFEEATTAGPKDATRIAADAVTAGYHRLLSVGGDGTLHEVVNGCVGADIAVGVLPLGTGNDFARSVGMLRPVRELLPALAAGRTRQIDLGQVHGQHYLQVAGVGFDAEVARITASAETKQGGALVYVLTAVRHAFRYEPALLSIALDDEPAEPPTRRLMVAVGNAPAFAGGMRICPKALLDDGRLDVVLVDDRRGWRILELLPLVFVGRHVGRPGVAYRQARTVRVEGPASAAVQADGEVVGGLPATFSVRAGTLRLWVA